jgi:hypothetical protein
MEPFRQKRNRHRFENPRMRMSMRVAHDFIIDDITPAAGPEQHLATWYTQGHSDGFGDRLLMFDNTSAPSWEILRFRPALAREPAFDSALRQRVEQLTSFRHPAFPLVRPLKGFAQEDGLAVVSTFAPGVRLTEAIKRPRGIPFTLRLLHQLVPALAALQQHDRGIFHGAIDVDRILVTAEGQLTVREHMVGSGLAGLHLPAATLWSDYQIIAASADVASPDFDARTDVIQVGILVLSLLAGRRVLPEEYPGRIEALLDEVGQRNGSGTLAAFQRLRYWLERALQLDEYMFESAVDAAAALSDLHDDAGRADGFRHLVGAWPDAPAAAAAAGEEPRRLEEHGARPSLTGVVDHVEASVRQEPQRTPKRSRSGRWMYWAAAFVALVAIAEAGFIGRLLYGRVMAPLTLPSPKLPETARTEAPAVLPIDQRNGDIGSSPDDARLTGTKGNGAPTAAAAVVSASQRNGGMRLTASFEVHVLDHDRVLGSSADGPIVAPAGQHEFEFVNSVIGYRVRKVVDIKPGQITPVWVPQPTGTLNINAVPWAAVWLDGNPLGDTPLGNVLVPAGEHELVFRHPQLGERREKTLVRADGATRVTVNFER